MMPRSAAVVVVVPSMAQLGSTLKFVEQLKVTSFIAATQGFSEGRGLADALMSQLGVDLRHPEALQAAGLDPNRGLGLAIPVLGPPYLVLPVKDPVALHRALERLSYARLGAGAGNQVTVDGVEVKTFSLQHGQVPRVAYAVVQGWALVAVDQPASGVAGFARLSEMDSLANDAQLRARLSALQRRPDAWVYLPAGTPLLADALVTSAFVSATLGSTGLTLFGQLSAREGGLSGLERRPGPELLHFVPADAFLVARSSGDPARLAPLATSLVGARVNRALTERGFDLQGELFSKLQPGAVAALSLAERPPMDRGMPELDVRRTNPFAFVHLSGAAPLKSGEAESVQPLLRKLAFAAAGFGADMKQIERQGKTVFFTTWSQGEGVHLAAVGDHLLFAAPLHRLDALLGQAGGPSGSTSWSLPSAGMAVRLDLRRLSDSVRALPESAWGLGGFAIKATTVRWLDAVSDLTSVTLTVDQQGPLAEVRLTLELQGSAAEFGSAGDAGR